MSDRDVIIEIRGDIKDINAKLQGLRRESKATADAMKGGFAGVNKTIVGLRDAAAGIIATFYSLGKAWDLMNMAAKAEQERRAFSALAASFGADADKLVAQLKRVSAETISTARLVRTAGSAMMMGIAPDDVVRLMEIARATTRQTGQTVQKAFEDIALGVARQSRMILDNLGIIVQAGKANDAYAEKLGKTAAQLTDVEKKQAFMNSVLESGTELMQRMGEQVDTSADRLERMAASLENTKELVGHLALRAFNLMEGILKGIAAIRVGITGQLWRAIKETIELLDQIPGLDLSALRDKVARQYAFTSLGAEQLLAQAKQQIEDALTVDDGKPPPIKRLITNDMDPEEIGEEIAKDMQTALEKAQAEFEHARATATPLDLALRRGPQPLSKKEDQDALKLAEQYAQEFEAAKDSVTALDEALMVTDATLSRLHAPVESFTEFFSDRWGQMVDTARSDIEFLAATAADALNQMASGIGRSFADALVHGRDLGHGLREVFKQVAADIIAMLIETQIQKTITHLIGKAAFMTSTIAQANAGVMLSGIHAFSSTAAIPIVGPVLAPAAMATAIAATMPLAVAAQAAAAAYGEGGISWKPELALVGEKGPEAHIPLKGGKVPVDIAGGGHGDQIFNVYVSAIDAKSFADTCANNPGGIGLAVERLLKSNSRLRQTMKRYR